jgi:hypothetical protein
MTERVVWHVVKEYAGKLNLDRLALAPHDLRRSCGVTVKPADEMPVQGRFEPAVSTLRT